MAVSNMNDGVGKKIVEALKVQSEESDNSISVDFDDDNYKVSDNFETDYEASMGDELKSYELSDDVNVAFNESLKQNIGTSFVQNSPDDIEYPTNVRVLRQLITKLPAGVSKQTGAVIIRQTMEALGISMNSVLKEATEVQDMLINNSKECKNSILEYKKQINVLEHKSQQYQKQASVMNDIISLFVQTSK